MTTRTATPNAHEPVSAADILGVATGTGGREAARRVFAAAVKDRALRERVALSLPPEDEDAEIAGAISDATVPAPTLDKRLRGLTEKYVRIPAPTAPGLRDRFLDALDTLLTLPCLAPALAAPDTSAPFAPITQTIDAGQGVRVAFQQLPPLAPDAVPMLRVVVDASDTGERGYTLAEVTIADGDRRVSIAVPLGAEGRGYVGVAPLPPSTAPRRLTSVRLAAR